MKKTKVTVCGSFQELFQAVEEHKKTCAGARFMHVSRTRGAPLRHEEVLVCSPNLWNNPPCGHEFVVELSKVNDASSEAVDKLRKITRV